MPVYSWFRQFTRSPLRQNSAIAARPAEKPDTHALTDHPALNARTKRIDPPDDLMAWDARPFDRKQSFHCAGIRVADPTRLDADPHLAGVPEPATPFPS